jgi:hypothetical protein
MSDDMIKSNPPAKPNKYYMSAQARRAHVRAYQSGNDSMTDYCEKNHLSLMSFKIWLSRYGEKKISSDFIPVLLSQKNEAAEIKKHTTPVQRLEITIGIVKITFPEIIDLETTIKLIQGLSHANKAQCADGVVLQ